METNENIALDPATLPEFMICESTNLVAAQSGEIEDAVIVSLEPGAYSGVPEDVYHALPYVSSSFLKKFKDCPADVLAPMAKTDSMEIGSALHCYILEGPEVFARKYVTMFESDLNKNSNDYKKKAKEFAEENDKKIILPSHTSKTPTMDVIKGVHNSLQDHPAAFKLLAQEGVTELTLIWDDPITGLRCKARLDFFTEGVIVDLKKTPDVLKFRNALVSFNYDIQSAWYLAGAQACDLFAEKFAFIAMEAEPPYKVATGYLSNRWSEYGKLEIQRLLGLVKECKERNYFPAYQIPDHINSLEQLNAKDLMIEWDMPSWRISNHTSTFSQITG
jgi:hypothetical protein